MDKQTVTQVENAKTGDSHTFFSKVSNSFLEIDSEIMQIKEKIEDPNDHDNAIHKDELKALRDQREILRKMLDDYKHSNFALDQETTITTTWENLKSSCNNLLKKFSPTT